MLPLPGTFDYRLLRKWEFGGAGSRRLHLGTRDAAFIYVADGGVVLAPLNTLRVILNKTPVFTNPGILDAIVSEWLKAKGDP